MLLIRILFAIFLLTNSVLVHAVDLTNCVQQVDKRKISINVMDQTSDSQIFQAMTLLSSWRIVGALPSGTQQLDLIVDWYSGADASAIIAIPGVAADCLTDGEWKAYEDGFSVTPILNPVIEALANSIEAEDGSGDCDGFMVTILGESMPPDAMGYKGSKANTLKTLQGLFQSTNSLQVQNYISMMDMFLMIRVLVVPGADPDETYNRVAAALSSFDPQSTFFECNSVTGVNDGISAF